MKNTQTFLFMSGAVVACVGIFFCGLYAGKNWPAEPVISSPPAVIQFPPSVEYDYGLQCSIDSVYVLDGIDTIGVVPHSEQSELWSILIQDNE